MNEKVLQTLEYNKIIDMLTEKADSDPGRKLCRGLKPYNDINVINEAQTQTSDALSRLFKKGSTSFGGNKDLGYALKSLEVGGVLSVTELLGIAGLLENVSRIKTYGKREREEEEKDSLDDLFELLEPLAPLSQEIRRCILSEDEISDDASPALKHIRRSMRLANEKIHSQLTGMLGGSCRTYLQDAVITMRNDRYCIPVKAEYKNQVPGMIHDQSSTGSTLFIEPAAVVSLNNQIKELALKEQEEIRQILTGLSAQAAGYIDAISQNQKIMTKLDFIFAKASLAMEQNATAPVFNTDGYVNIRKGRHPLLG